VGAGQLGRRNFRFYIEAKKHRQNAFNYQVTELYQKTEFDPAGESLA